MLFPDNLKRGDKIAILSPASIVKAEYIDSAAEYIYSKGYEPLVMPHAKGPASGSYSASLNDRLSDILTAWKSPDIKGVLCSRGGYGAVHLLKMIPGELLRANPRWLIGFSDISALHALSFSQGVASIHGPMTRHWHESGKEAEFLFDILQSGKMPEYEFKNHTSDSIPQNIPGKAKGTLIGGNLAVLNGLSATPYDMLAAPLYKDCILFIEDIAEPIYKIERIMYRLFLQGVLGKLKGLIAGAFTESNPDRNFKSTEQMIARFLKEHGLANIPVAFGAPIGHIEGNMPVIEGAEVTFEVTSDTAFLH